jgi:chemotaxis signal transduction protein
VVERLPELLAAVVVQVDTATVALPVSAVLRVLRIEKITEIPCAPSTLRGVALVDGEPLFVIQLSALPLGGRSVKSVTAGDGAELALFCRAGGERALLAGGHVRAVAELRRMDWSSPGRGELFDGAVEWRGGSIPLLALSRVLDVATGQRDERLSAGCRGDENGGGDHGRAGQS